MLPGWAPTVDRQRTPRRPESVIVQPVVLVHGTRTSSRIWQPQLDALAAAGHPVVTPDLPGHGTRLRERFTLAGALAAIDDAVRACDEPPLLVGLSLGGYTALAYAGRHGDEIAGVMLAGCSTEIKGKPLWMYRRSADAVARALHPGGTWGVVTDTLRELDGYSALADLRRLTMPVWLVNGRRDPLRFDEWRYVRARRGVGLLVVPGAGHDVNTHAPAAFNRALLDALAVLRVRSELVGA